MSKSELSKFYSRVEIAKIEATGEAESLYWSKQPVLPIEVDDKIELKEWGNRDKNVDLPKTGWAKDESLESGKWDYLHPEPVRIPVEKGYEKGVWFDVKEKGLAGVLVKKDQAEKVYMITKKASSKYEKLTHHDREPVRIGKNAKHK